MKPTPTRLRLTVRGLVQGVGFRPFIHRLATSLDLAGQVWNDGHGVVIEVEGIPEDTRGFLLGVEAGKPPHAAIHSLEPRWLEPRGLRGFEILPSPADGPRRALVLPDIATCPDCLREILDPADRRFGYPFTNCTNCGPRFSIIESTPYDRPRTSMKAFPMCGACRAEYADPENRRFHAQPNACPECGPQLSLVDPSGTALPGDPIESTATALLEGSIVAVKGIGGFHLMARADDPDAVRRLRRRKHREEKPFALLVPDLETTRRMGRIGALEERLLRSPEAPIVLLERAPGADDLIAAEVAPGAPMLGIMLPSNPLHHLLTRHVGVPLVATSGNLSDEPICTDHAEALQRLGGIADLFLLHDRPIVRHVDDSIVRVLLGRETVLRRARGYAPLPVPWKGEAGILATGPQLKNTVAISTEDHVFLSQHLGDLETEPAVEAHEQALDALVRLFDQTPTRVAADLHPDYRSTRTAEKVGLPVMRIQHHHAHALACMAENEIEPPALAIVWDGTGYGTDGTIWGGEFLRITGDGFERLAHLRPFPLPGGDRAAREPRRSLAGMLHEVWRFELLGDRFSPAEKRLLGDALRKGIGTVTTTSAGRLIDGVTSLLGIRHISHYEAQSATALEFSAAAATGVETLPVVLDRSREPWVLDWEPWVVALHDGVERGDDISLLARRFLESLIDGCVEVARRAGEPRIVLSGGCFQNRLLLEGTVGRLRQAGLQPFWHQRVPPNDGGVALGQIVGASLQKRLPTASSFRPR